MADYARENEPKARSMTLAERVARIEERLGRFDEDMAEAHKTLAQHSARIETAENELGIDR